MPTSNASNLPGLPLEEKSSSVAQHDALGLGLGGSIDALRLISMLALSRDDVARIAGVAPSAIRYDDAMPQTLRENLQEIAKILNMAAHFFAGDEAKTVAWLNARNPMLGDISPRDMVRFGRKDQLRRFIEVQERRENALARMADNARALGLDY